MPRKQEPDPLPTYRKAPTRTLGIALSLLLLPYPAQSQRIVTVIDTSAGIFSHPSLSIGPDNLPVAVFSDSLRTIRVLKCGNAECSAGNTVSALDAVKGMGFYSEVLVTPDNKPLVAYSQSDSSFRSRFVVLKCLDAACSSTTEPVPVGPEPLDAYDIEWILGSDGLPLLSYCNNSRILARKCLDLACTAFSPLAVIDTSRSVACETDAAIGKDGNPILTYLDGEGRLKITRCGSLDCSSGNSTTTVDSAALTGFHASIDVGPQGVPAVSFSRLSDRALYVLKCGDAECRNGNSLVKINNQGDPIGYTEIGIGSDGLPRVAFENLYRGRVQLLKCGDPECRSIRSNAVVDSGGNYLEATFVFRAGGDGLPMAATLRRPPGQSLRNSASFVIVKCMTEDCLDPGMGVVKPPFRKASTGKSTRMPWLGIFDLRGRSRSP